MEIFTCSYRAYRSHMGQPVVTSLGLPKWIEEAPAWPVLHLATPRWSYFRAPRAEFDAAYLAQLDRFGPRKFARALHGIAEESGRGQLVLLCHEGDWDNCHRQTLARWLQETSGDLVRELRPAARVVIPRPPRLLLPFEVNPQPQED